MPSNDSTLVMDLGLSSSFTHSVDTISLGMDHTIENSLPSSSMTSIETMVAIVPQKNVIQIHE
jgi:hypothetical protein